MSKISVIVPVYNVEEYLPECIDSILEQSFTDIEVVCVNDGSTDGCADILSNYQKADERIRVIYQVNQGLSVARNTGIDYATGEYICFVDSDDILKADALEILWKEVSDGTCDIVTFETDVIYENEQLRISSGSDYYYHVENEYPTVERGRKLFCRKVSNGDYIESAWLFFINRQWLISQNIRFEHGALFEDSIFSLQCYFQCDRMKHIKNHIHIYRIRENSIMTGKTTYKHAYYRIWQVAECLRAIYTLAADEEEIQAISKYTEQCIAAARAVYHKLNKSDKKRVSELASLYGLLGNLIGFDEKVDVYEQGLELAGLMSILERYKYIIIYGAGVVGSKTRRILEDNLLGNKILGFAVSEGHGKLEQDGYQVRYIGDYQVNDETVVLISVRETFQKDMLNEARVQGFNNVYIIDWKIENQMDKKLCSSVFVE